MNGNRSLTATFTAVAQHTVTAVVLPAGAGTVVLDPAGGTYNQGATVTLTTVTAPGLGFTGWSGDLTGAVNPARWSSTATRTSRRSSRPCPTTC